MSSSTAAVASNVSIQTVPSYKMRPLGSALAQARAKIREDLFRFRTCCADPRASK